MTMTSTDVATIPPMAHHEAMRLQSRELDITLAMLRSLGSAEWSAPTDFPVGMSGPCTSMCSAHVKQGRPSARTSANFAGPGLIANSEVDRWKWR